MNYRLWKTLLHDHIFKELKHCRKIKQTNNNALDWEWVNYAIEKYDYDISLVFLFVSFASFAFAPSSFIFFYVQIWNFISMQQSQSASKSARQSHCFWSRGLTHARAHERTTYDYVLCSAMVARSMKVSPEWSRWSTSRNAPAYFPFTMQQQRAHAGNGKFGVCIFICCARCTLLYVFFSSPSFWCSSGVCKLGISRKQRNASCLWVFGDYCAYVCDFSSQGVAGWANFNILFSASVVVVVTVPPLTCWRRRRGLCTGRHGKEATQKRIGREREENSSRTPTRCDLPTTCWQ